LFSRVLGLGPAQPVGLASPHVQTRGAGPHSVACVLGQSPRHARPAAGFFGGRPEKLGARSQSLEAARPLSPCTRPGSG